MPASADQTPLLGRLNTPAATPNRFTRTRSSVT